MIANTFKTWFAHVRAEPVAMGALLVLAGGALAFFGLADEVGEGDTHGLDMAVLTALRVGGDPAQPVGPDWLQLAAADLTALGSIAVLSLIVVLTAGLFLMLRRPGGALVLLIASGGGVAVSQGLKVLFGRERPPLAYHAVEAANPSFPSGHAMLSAVVFLTLGIMAARLVKGRAGKVYVIGAAALAALLVGATRVYLGVHWASDVLAGWCVGAAWAMAAWLVWWWLGRFRRRPYASAPPVP